jgi:hypothetical protein
MSVWIYGLKKYKPNQPSCNHNTPYHTPTITYCNGFSWINARNVLLWKETGLHRWREREWVPFFHLYEGTSSQNSILLYELCRRVCEPRLTRVDVNAAVLLHFVLCRHARSLYGWSQRFRGRCLYSSKILRQLARVVCLFLSRMERIAGNVYTYMWFVVLFATNASGIFCLNLQHVLLELYLAWVS